MKTGHRAVNAAGEQQTGPCPFIAIGMPSTANALDGQIRMVADLDHHRVIRMIDVHPSAAAHMVGDIAARLAYDRRRTSG